MCFSTPNIQEPEPLPPPPPPPEETELELGTAKSKRDKPPGRSALRIDLAGTNKPSRSGLNIPT